MNKELEILNNDDVVAVLKHDEGKFSAGDTLKVLQLLTEYEGYIKGQVKTNNHEAFIQGIECKILRHDGKHSGWRAGKIKFVLQFEPEEPSSDRANSLDDLRHQLNQ